MLALLALLLVPSPKAVHCFIPTFAWSSDDRKLALIDEVEGEGAGKFLVIIPVNSPEQSRQFKILPKQGSASGDQSKKSMTDRIPEFGPIRGLLHVD